MCKARASKAVYVVLILSSCGCRSEYRFRCTSNPSEAGVVVGQEMMGETPCTVKIPKDSELIQGGKIEFTFCLPAGQERKHTISLDGLKPTNPVAEIVAAPFLLAGIGLLALSHGDNTDEEHQSAWDSDRAADDTRMDLLGIGALGAGVGLYYLLGGDTDSLRGYPVHVDFTQSAEDQGQPAPSAVPETEVEFSPSPDLGQPR